MRAGPRPRAPGARLLRAAIGRRWKLGPARNPITVQRDVPVRMRDGVALLADHYAPAAAGPWPTVLMRCPYGRGLLYSAMAWPYAERGYHVLLQSTRGTSGSGGTFRPYADEAADGQDTVAWLRGQDWFDGRLATVGSSYLGYVQWALTLDPPAELRAMAIQIAPHDLGFAAFGHGPFELYNRLAWSAQMAHQQEQRNALRQIWGAVRRDKRVAPLLSRLPLTSTGAAFAGNEASWYSEWLAHPDLSDVYWDARRATAALERAAVPVLLIGGFHDQFYEQTMLQYQALQRRGVPVGLTVGPWTHLGVDVGLATRETLAWLDAFVAGTGPSPRSQPVRVWTGGIARWSERSQWPPPGAAPVTWYLQSGGVLASDTLLAGSGSPAGVSDFAYDPLEPTPSVGGRTTSYAAGSRDNRDLEARADVLTFSTAPLAEPVEIAGAPSLQLYFRCDGGSADVFARLCDLSESGESRNLTDQIIRLGQAELVPGEACAVSISLPDVSHVFLAGHRIRLQVSGGAFPRYARNLGTTADQVTGTQTAVVHYGILHGQPQPSALTLPVLGPQTRPAAGDPG
jgi:uncharacterized protein